MIMTPRYAIDTQVFNWMRDFEFDLSVFQPAQFFISPVQMEELKAGNDTELLRLVDCWIDEVQPAESFVFGVKGGGFGQGKFSDGRTYSRILNALNAAKKKRNNPQDSLIGEHAYKNGLILLTGDLLLAETMKRLGGKVHFVEHPSKATLD